MSGVPTKILLANGEFALIDQDDYDKVKDHKWCKTARGYVATSLWIDGKKPLLAMHRLIMGDPKGMYIDHINHNPLDNRKSNLRICTNTQNQWNAKINNRNSSGYKGVSYEKHRRGHKKWSARIQYNGIKKRLGNYTTKEEAALGWNEGAKKLHGQFANLNKVEVM